MRASRAVLLRADEPDLLPADEAAEQSVNADEARIRRPDDDGPRHGAHSVVMSLDALVSTRARVSLRPTARRAALTVHIVAGVGLLGSVAAVLAINVRAASTGDPALAAACYELLSMFTLLFGIPLSFISLGTGVVLGLGSAWGVVRHAWVVAKLALLLGVIAVGAFVLGPGTDAMRSGAGGAEARLIAGSAYDLVALTVATGLSVFKPRRRRRERRPGPAAPAPQRRPT